MSFPNGSYTIPQNNVAKKDEEIQLCQLISNMTIERHQGDDANQIRRKWSSMLNNANYIGDLNTHSRYKTQERVTPIGPKKENKRDAKWRNPYEPPTKKCKK